MSNVITSKDKIYPGIDMDLITLRKTYIPDYDDNIIKMDIVKERDDKVFICDVHLDIFNKVERNDDGDFNGQVMGRVCHWVTMVYGINLCQKYYCEDNHISITITAYEDEGQSNSTIIKLAFAIANIYRFYSDMAANGYQLLLDIPLGNKLNKTMVGLVYDKKNEDLYISYSNRLSCSIALKYLKAMNIKCASNECGICVHVSFATAEDMIDVTCNLFKCNEKRASAEIFSYSLMKWLVHSLVNYICSADIKSEFEYDIKYPYSSFKMKHVESGLTMFVKINGNENIKIMFDQFTDIDLIEVQSVPELFDEIYDHIRY